MLETMLETILEPTLEPNSVNSLRNTWGIPKDVQGIPQEYLRNI